MFNVEYVTTAYSVTGIVGSFGQGYTSLPKPINRIVTQDDILAYALYLEHTGKLDEADDLLESYLAGNHTRH